MPSHDDTAAAGAGPRARYVTLDEISEALVGQEDSAIDGAPTVSLAVVNYEASLTLRAWLPPHAARQLAAALLTQACAIEACHDAEDGARAVNAREEPSHEQH